MAVITCVLIATDVVWMARDHSAPTWDSAYYLGNAWTEVLAHHQSWHAAVEAILHTDPGHAPLFELLTAFFMGLIGPSAHAGLLVNMLALPFLLVSVAGIAHRLGGRRAAIWSVAICAVMPVVVGLSRWILEDFLVTATCATAVFASIRCNRFNSLSGSLLFAVAGAFAMLSKVTAPGQIGVAVLVGLALGAGPAVSRRPSKRQVAHFAIALAMFLALTLAWYIPNFAGTRMYFDTRVSGPAALGTGSPHPLALSALWSYFRVLFAFWIGWGTLLAVVAGGFACLPKVARVARTRSGAARRDLLLRVALPFAWLLPALLVQATSSSNQSQRLVAPAVMAVPVLAGWLLAATPARWPRVVTVLAVAVSSVYPLITHTFGADANHIAGKFYGSSYLALYKGNQPIGYEVPPQPNDYAAPMVKWLLAQRAGHGITGTITVGALANNGTTDPNTLRWEDLRLTNTNVIVSRQPTAAGMTKSQIQAEFAAYDAVITFSQAAIGDQTRLVLLDSGLVTSQQAGPYLKAFRGPTMKFPLVLGSATIHWRSS